MSTQAVAIQRAITLLNAAGADYKIIAPDGTEYGALLAQKAQKIKRKRTGVDFKSIYRPVMDQMQPGDTRKIVAPPRFPRGWIAQRDHGTCV
jgi:hypothetical protein